MEKYTIPFARFAIFIIYFWFGLLKVLGLSPATPLVEALFQKTVVPLTPFIAFSTFIILFGLFEMLIGLMFLVKKLDRASLWILVLHLIMTALPLVFLPGMVWTHPFTPTMEGQYIIKNVAIIALALSILVHSRTHESEHV